MGQTGLNVRIARILRELQIRNVDFAKTLGISANYVSQLLGGRKTQISHSVANLIECSYGYRAAWVLTGEGPVHATNTLRGLQENTVDKIMRMDGGELRAVAAYIRLLNNVREGTETALPEETADFSEKLYALTAAERRVYDLFSLRLNAKQTAEALGLSPNTVKTHLKKIYKKCSVTSRMDLFDKMRTT